MIEVQFVRMREEFVEDIRQIYNYYVLNTTASFHQHELTVTEMQEILFYDDPRFQSFAIIATDLGQVIGYVGLKRYSVRESYNATAEVSMYLRSDFLRQGIGAIAFQHIEQIAIKNSFHVLIATVGGENKASISACESVGFERVACYREIGWKFDHWLDLVAFEKILS